jgi:putative NADPH-quinone reductase
MKVLIVYAHPENQSFNYAMFCQAQQSLLVGGHEVKTSDLYAMRFNSVSDAANFLQRENPNFLKLQLEELHATASNTFAADIATEQDKIDWCDLMIWQFPLWWFSVPAIMKGWADRVFAMGRTYGQGRIYQTGVFKHKKALLSLTTGGSTHDYKDDGLQGDLSGILRPLQRGILEFTGFIEQQRTEELQRWEHRLQGINLEEGIVVGKYK